MADQTASDVLADRLIDWGVEPSSGCRATASTASWTRCAPGTTGSGTSTSGTRKSPRWRPWATPSSLASSGVCFATSGPGAVHLMNGLLDAKVEQAPLLAITGMTYHDLIGTSYLQDINTDYLMNDIAAV